MTRGREISAAIKQARALYASSYDYDEVLTELKQAGHDITASMHATKVVLGITWNETQERVVISPAWADQAEWYLELNQALMDEIELLGGKDGVVEIRLDQFLPRDPSSESPDGESQ